MIICPNCGGENPEGSRFCMFCAHKLSESASDSQTTLKSGGKSQPVILTPKPKGAPEHSQPVILTPKPKGAPEHSQPVVLTPKPKESKPQIAPITPPISEKPEFKLSDAVTNKFSISGPGKSQEQEKKEPIVLTPAPKPIQHSQPIILKPKKKGKKEEKEEQKGAMGGVPYIQPPPVSGLEEEVAPSVPIDFHPPAPPPPKPETKKEEPPAEKPSEKAEASPKLRLCKTCGANVPEGFVFCGKCGTKYEELTEKPSAVGLEVPDLELGEGAPVAEVVKLPPPPAVFLANKPEGEPLLTISEQKVTVGSAADVKLPEGDPFISPVHALFRKSDKGVFVAARSGTNGVFKRVTAAVKIENSDEILSSGYLFHYSKKLVNPVEGREMVEDDIPVFGSPMPEGWGRLSHLIIDGGEGNSWLLFGESAKVGKEGDLQPSDDPKLPKIMFELKLEGKEVTLIPPGEKEGVEVFKRIYGEESLADGDILVIGTTRLVIKIPAE
ncbi:MAG: hypothetical protein Kow0090_00030 [Myxococcota bacterium]